MANVRNVTPNNFTTIDRLWAENGVVRIIKKNGEQTTLTPKEAAQRAVALNKMNVPDWNKRSRNELVTRIVEVVREAQGQQESPKDTKTAALNNALAGKSLDGKEVKETVDQQVRRFMFMFPTISEKDAGAVAIDKNMLMQDKEAMLKEIHRQNMLNNPQDNLITVTPTEKK